MEGICRENRSDNLTDNREEKTLKSLTDIVDGIHKNEATGLTKDQITTVLKAGIASIASALQGSEEVRINNFGTFSVADRAERMGRNPATGEQKLIPASKAVKFKASKALKDQVAS